MEKTLTQFYKEMEELNEKEKNVSTWDDREKFYKEKNDLAYQYISSVEQNGIDPNVVVTYDFESEFYYDKLIVELPSGEQFVILPITMAQYEEQENKTPVIFDYIKNNINKTSYYEIYDEYEERYTSFMDDKVGSPLDEMNTDTKIHFNKILPDDLKITEEKVNEKMYHFLQNVIDNNIQTEKDLSKMLEDINENIAPTELQLQLFMNEYDDKSNAISTNFGYFKCDKLQQFVKILNNIREHESRNYFENVNISEENIKNTLNKINVTNFTENIEHNGNEFLTLTYQVSIGDFTILKGHTDGSRTGYEYENDLKEIIDKNKIALMAIIDKKDTFTSIYDFEKKLRNLTKQYNNFIKLEDKDLDSILKDNEQKSRLIQKVIKENKNNLEMVKKILENLPEEEKQNLLKNVDDFGKEMITFAMQKEELDKNTVKE